MEENNNVVCTLCDEVLDSQMIEMETKHCVDVAYIMCPDCDSRFNLMFDTKGTKKIKDKIKIANEVLNYLQMELYREMLKAEDVYYKAEYDELSAEEKKLIGDYSRSITKEQEKNYNEVIKSKKYNIADLMRLIK